MASNQDLIFKIIYYDQEIIIEVSKRKTVGDLKIEIKKLFGIEPNLQKLDCWYRNPENDNCVLENCCLQNGVNNLVLNLHLENGYDTNDKVDYLNRQENMEEVPELFSKLEEKCCLNFLEYLTNNYNYTGVDFNICSFKCALDNSCFAPINDRKILLLFLHNKTSNFSKVFCTALKNKQIQEIVNRSFFSLGWDVENSGYHNALSTILNSYIELLDLVNLVKRKTCAALFIVPINQSISIFTCMQGNFKEKDILATFRNVEDSFRTELGFEEELAKVPRNENARDFDSVKVQQLMFDLLGDRDYDSFEHDQHDLLKNKIGYAFFGPPTLASGYDNKQNEKIDSIFRVILRENNQLAKWKDRVVISFIYNCMEPLPDVKVARAKEYSDYNPKTDLTPIPIFVLRKCKKSDQPCRIFIDDIGRVYENWAEYINRNKLPKCQMTLPLNGRYQTNENGKVSLEVHLSPACGIDVKILQGTDIASTAVGLVSGGILVAAAIPVITVAPIAILTAGVTGIGVGVYAIGRSIYSLYDKGKHKESLSFADSEARGAYLNILAGSLGIFGAGANFVVSQLVARGANIGQGGMAVVNTINVVNLSASGATVLNSGYDILDQWINENQPPTLLTAVQLSASVLFFGNALYNFRAASTIIEETQTNTLKKYSESLRNNKHRKMFNKLTKETIRMAGGNVKTGVSEVISAIRNMNNKDEVFATLAKSNKVFNKNGVRFAAGNGKIKLNGIEINIGQFFEMTKTEVNNFLTNLPGIPQPDPVQVTSMMNRLNFNFSCSGQLVMQLAKYALLLFGNSNEEIKEKLINAFVDFASDLMKNNPQFMRQLDEIFPNHDKFMRLLDMVTHHFDRLVTEVECQFLKWKKTKNDEYKDPAFVTFSLDFSKRVVQIFKFVTSLYFFKGNLTKLGLKELLNYFHTWLAKQIYTYQENLSKKEQRRIHSGRNGALEVKCDECGGICYKP